MTRSQTPGTLIIIGGHEDKEGERVILREVARELRGGRLVLATVASRQPEGYLETYQRAFAPLGVTAISELHVREWAETLQAHRQALFDGAAGVFFSGGDQLRITSQIGNTPIEARVREVYARGGVVAGTSAGASVMSETMLVRGSSSESYRIGDLHMAPGLGLIRDVTIDQHFGERGRIGRLLGAVAHNPRALGIGIDEDTAVVVCGGPDAQHFRVIGAGAVYILDGAGVTSSNITEGRSDRTLSITDVRLHVLSHGDTFDLSTRRPGHTADVKDSHALESPPTQTGP